MTDEHTCPICAVAFKSDDICATDIEMGTCHAECLEGSAVVDLETGDELPDGKIDTYPYSDVAKPKPAPSPSLHAQGDDQPRYTTKRLHDEIAKARAYGMELAASMCVERAAEYDASFDSTAYKTETLAGSAALTAIAAKIRERADSPSPAPNLSGDGEAAIIECLSAGNAFVFDPATNFLHADDGTVEGGIRYAPAPVPLVACPCALIEQDEDCPVGYPSMLCGICKGTGNTTQEQVTALACEMIKIASDIGEPEDPFAAWESIDLIKSQHGQLRAALKPFAAAPYTGPNSFNRAALSDDDFRKARHVIATTEGK